MNINTIAVIVTGIIHMGFGLIWYADPLFGKAWSELTGKELKPAPAWIVPAILGHQAIALGLAVIIDLANITTWLAGAGAGLLVALAFFVTLEIGELTWEKIPVKLFLIRSGYHLTAMALIGAILAMWK